LVAQGVIGDLRACGNDCTLPCRILEDIRPPFSFCSLFFSVPLCLRVIIFLSSFCSLFFSVPQCLRVVIFLRGGQ
jgi:hypothetical protein